MESTDQQTVRRASLNIRLIEFMRARKERPGDE
jgi:hypothetical protein